NTKFQDKSRLQGNVEFVNVAFSYPTRSEVEVLKDINFTATFGEKIALVGPSGAGKSTIASLLLRFYDITKGQLKIDGKPIQEFDLRQLRTNMSIVPQDVILFGGTIRENIAYGKPEATEAEIYNAARQANAYDFIE